MKNLILKLQKDFPSISFESGKLFCWSPESQKVTFKANTEDKMAIWSLLHEVGHALLGHTTYRSDFNLLQLEVEAWHKAKELALKYSVEIDNEHIEDCLDTYRDWLYKRSLCPVCNMISLQSDERTYRCFNCGAEWRVTKSKMCRPYRLQRKEAQV